MPLQPTPPQVSGYPHIHYKNGILLTEDIALHDLVHRYSTPLFVYSKAAILGALNIYQRGFVNRNALICYSVKANSSLAILQILANAGCGFDIVSGGELERVQAAGGDMAKVIFSGVGKTRKEMQYALDANIGCFNIESDAELEVLNQVASKLGKIAPISIRVNPDVDPKTHPYISTGLKTSKFGVMHDKALALYRRAATMSGIKIVGIDCHIGSQITEEAPYLDAMDKVLDLITTITSAGITLEHVDFGGGLGINYNGEQPPQADNLWQKLFEKLDNRGFNHLKIIIEPGRSLVGNAGLCITEVLFLKEGDDKNFCVVDAAMNDLPRPAMYQAHHRIVPLNIHPHAPHAAVPQKYDIVGPICESGDWLGRDRLLDVKSGDFLAVLSAGAYCMSMASNYNSRGRAAEILIDQSNIYLIKEREASSDIFKNENLIKFD